MANGKSELAATLALRIWNESTGNPETAFLAGEALSHDVPNWHFSLVRDRIRNAAYDAALRRAIKPGMRVLDIGSGTGLLAMMAARAGAAQVYSCEMNPAVADAARDVVAANGLSDRIQVIAKHSGLLNVEADLGGRVDLVVSEIVSNNMLNEDVLPIMEYAVGNLLKPGGGMIPAKGTVRIALAFDPDRKGLRMGITDGFDLTAFNRLAEPSYMVSSVAERLELQLRSDSVDFLSFDFQRAEAVREGRVERVLKARGGPVNCVVQSIHLEMDEAGSYENRPDSPEYSCWATVAYPLSGEAVLAEGDSLTVHGAHDLHHMWIWTTK